MALSGTVNSSAYGERYIQLTWTATQSITANTSTVSWTLKGAGGATNTYYMAGGFTVVINGTTVYSKSTDYRIQLFNGTTVASGTTTIAHNTDGTKSFSISIKAGIYTYAVNCTGSATFTLNTIPRAASITSAPNFNDEASPVIVYSNPLGNSVTSLQACISLTGADDDIAYRDISKTGTSYTFELTDAERDVLRNATADSNSRTVRFYVKTVYSGTTYYSQADRTLSIINAQPTLTASVTDSNSTTVAITGDSNKLVKYCSNATATATYAAFKGASIVSYSVTHGGQTLSTIPATFNAVESNAFTFTVKDSRGNSTTTTVEKTWISYEKLTCNMVAAKPTTDGETTLSVNGNFYNATIGTSQNAMTVYYRYRSQSDTDFTAWQTAASSIVYGSDSVSYSTDIEITGLDYRLAYTFQARAVDLLMDVSSAQRTVKALPVFDWGEDDFNINGTLRINGVNILDVFYPVGSICMRYDHIDPATLWGGEWIRLYDYENNWGVFPYATSEAGVIGETGGEAAHTLTVSEMPRHSHTVISNVGVSALGNKAFATSGSSLGFYYGNQDVSYQGSSAAHNNIPPFIKVSMWRRTA